MFPHVLCLVRMWKEFHSRSERGKKILSWTALPQGKAFTIPRTVGKCSPKDRASHHWKH